MKEQHSPEEMELLLDAALLGGSDAPTSASGRGASVDADTTRLVNDLRALAEATEPRPGFLAELEARLALESGAEARPAAVLNGVVLRPAGTIRPRRRWSATGLGRVAAVLLLALGVGAVLRAAPTPGQNEPPPCFVPGFGIGPCDSWELAAPQPVSESRDGMTLTVTHLYAAAGETTVGLELDGLAAPFAPRLLEQTRLALRDERGEVQAQTVRHVTWGLAFGLPAAFSAAPSMRAELLFGRLSDAAQAVDVLVDGPPPVGAWTVHVPVVPAEATTTRLARARHGDSSAETHGVAVRITGLLTDAERTAVQLAAQTTPPLRALQFQGPAAPTMQVSPADELAAVLPPPGDMLQVAPAAGLAMLPIVPADARPVELPPDPALALLPGGPVVLEDDSGRQYAELAFVGRRTLERGEVVRQNLLFPPLAADARSAQLILARASGIEPTDEASIVIRVAGRRIGERFPLGTEVKLGPHPLRVAGARIVGAGEQTALALEVEPLPGESPRRLVGPARARLAGQEDASVHWLRGPPLGYHVQGPVGSPGEPRPSLPPLPIAPVRLPDSPAERWLLVGGTLPAGADQVTVLLGDAVVAIDGPWHLKLQVQR